MGKKRRHFSDSDEEIQKKIRKLESKLKSSRRRIILSESESDSNTSTNDPTDQSATGVASTAPAVDVTIAGDTAPSCSHQPDQQVMPSPPTDGVHQDEELDEATLLLLGDAPKDETVMGKEIHKDVATRWQEILAKGLPKEAKDKLLKEYLIPANCTLLLPPLLNSEIKAAIPDNLVKRDFYLMQKQKQTGIALAALSHATQLLLSKDSSPKELLKPISDACRLLCDNLYNDTRTRRTLITTSINADLKDTIAETVRDKYLFGESFSEKLKSAKNIQRSVADLKRPQKSNTFNKSNFILKQNDKTHLNWKPLHLKTSRPQNAGRPRQTHPPPKTTPRRSTSERSPARRTTRRK